MGGDAATMEKITRLKPAESAIAGLIAVISDRNADWTDRHDALLIVRRANEGFVEVGDAVLELDPADVPVEWRSADVIEVLRRVGTDVADLAVLHDEAGEALAHIWLATTNFDRQTYESLVPAAREAARGVIAANRRDWV